jgi:hypothetical protein
MQTSASGKSSTFWICSRPNFWAAATARRRPSICGGPLRSARCRRARASVESLAETRAPAPLLHCLHSLAARNEALLNQGRSLGGEVRDFRLGLEISVIQAFADRIVRLLKVRDPLSQRVHLSAVELLAFSIGGMGGEVARRATGRRTVSNPAAGA